MVIVSANLPFDDGQEEEKPSFHGRYRLGPWEVELCVHFLLS